MYRPEALTCMHVYIFSLPHPSKRPNKQRYSPRTSTRVGSRSNPHEGMVLIFWSMHRARTTFLMAYALQRGYLNNNNSLKRICPFDIKRAVCSPIMTQQQTHASFNISSQFPRVLQLITNQLHFATRWLMCTCLAVCYKAILKPSRSRKLVWVQLDGATKNNTNT